MRRRFGPEADIISSIGEEGVIRKLLAQMNSHVPARRRRLSELLSEQDSHYEGRDGRIYSVDRQELEVIEGIVRARGLSDIRLPILLMADPSVAQSAWRVEGRCECTVLSEILGRCDAEPPEKLLLYSPHVAVIIRELPTTTVCIYLG